MVHNIIKGATIKNYSCNDEHMILETDRGYFTVTAVGDCCSDSWFEYDEPQCNPHALSIETIIGNKIVSIEEAERDDLEGRNDSGECIKHYEVIMEFEDGTEYGFLMINNSNGYYSGWISITDSAPENYYY